MSDSVRHTETGASQSTTNKRLSFEFFPPRSDGQQRRLWRTLGCLETLSPEFVSVTWGALGSESAASLDLLAKLVEETHIPVAAHLTCAGQTREQVESYLEKIEALGIRHLVALRGDSSADPAKESTCQASVEAGVAGQRTGLGPSVQTLQHASDLVALINQRNARSAEAFDISVAAYPEVHPEADSASSDLHWLAQKFELGASRAITQFFFDPQTFLRWRDRAVANGIDGLLVPGILPIHDIDKVIAFSNKCGASVPIDVIQRFKKAQPSAREDIAEEQCLALCEVLSREGVENFHLYTLNQSSLAWKVGLELAGVDKVSDFQRRATAA